MEIIDAQIHALTPATPWSESFTPEQQVEASAELAVACMNAVGVDAAIVNWMGAEVKGYLARYPGRFAGLPFGSPMIPAELPVDEYIADIAATPGMVGIRLPLTSPLDDSRVELFRSGQFTPYFDAADREGLPVFVLMHGFLPELHDTIRKYENLKFVIDHVGLHTPPVRPLTPEVLAELPDVLALATFPNVAVKFTGVPSLSSEPYPFADMWPLAHQLIDAFGVDRLMWGSDFTRCASLHSYRESVDFLLQTDEVSASEKEALFSGTIRRWLDWPTPVPGAGAPAA
jgi:L-fuconolactonase